MAVSRLKRILLAGWAASGICFAQKGVVLDETSGKPLVLAVVMQKPSWAMVLTNNKGEFEFASANPIKPVRARQLRRQLRFSSDGTISIPPSLLPPGSPSIARIYSPQGHAYSLPIPGDGVVRLPSQVSGNQILFLRVGSFTFRLARLNGNGFIAGEISESSSQRMSALAKASAIPDTLIVSHYGYDAKAQLINGQDQGTIKLHPNAKAPPPGMIELKGATFTMGSRRDEVASPEHPVTVSGFYMDTVEVTQADYQLMMGNEFMSRGDEGYDINFGPQYPALNMSWYEAVLYCNRRSKRDGLDTVFTYTGRTPVPNEGTFNLDDLKIDLNAKGYRLATEAEWEYSCKGGQDSDYFWGTNRDNPDSTRIYAWYGDNSEIFGGTPTDCPVAKKKKNPFGLYDIVGNQKEYVLDSRVEPYPTSPNTDPFFQDHENPPSRNARGGGWGLPINSQTCTARSSIYAYPYSVGAGIRVILPIR